MHSNHVVNEASNIQYTTNQSLSPSRVAKLSTGQTCSSTPVASSYLSGKPDFLQYQIAVVTDFISNRDIKKEIDFTSKQYISQGLFGKVSRAYLHNGSMVAIKEIKKHAYTDYYPEGMIQERLWNEAADFIKINGNSRFVQLLGIYINDIELSCFSIAMVMELADGDMNTYKRALMENKDVQLSYENMRYIALEFLLLIDACRQVNINHLDFHLGNILVFYEGRKLKLADFDGIETFNDCRGMIYTSSLELLELSCVNYRMPETELSHLATNDISSKKEFKRKVYKLLGDDDKLGDIIAKPLISYKKNKIKKIKTDPIDKMISKSKKLPKEPFPILQLV
jgi:hypothetical protein